jgi:hypothetical protein
MKGPEFRLTILTAQAEKSYRSKLFESARDCGPRFVTFALAADKIESAE